MGSEIRQYNDLLRRQEQLTYIRNINFIKDSLDDDLIITIGELYDEIKYLALEYDFDIPINSKTQLTEAQKDACKKHFELIGYQFDSGWNLPNTLEEFNSLLDSVEEYKVTKAELDMYNYSYDERIKKVFGIKSYINDEIESLELDLDHAGSVEDNRYYLGRIDASEVMYNAILRHVEFETDEELQSFIDGFLEQMNDFDYSLLLNPVREESKGISI